MYMKKGLLRWLFIDTKQRKKRLIWLLSWLMHMEVLFSMYLSTPISSIYYAGVYWAKISWFIRELSVVAEIRDTSRRYFKILSFVSNLGITDQNARKNQSRSSKCLNKSPILVWFLVWREYLTWWLAWRGKKISPLNLGSFHLIRWIRLFLVTWVCISGYSTHYQSCSSSDF